MAPRLEQRGLVHPNNKLSGIQTDHYRNPNTQRLNNAEGLPKSEVFIGLMENVAE